MASVIKPGDTIQIDINGCGHRGEGVGRLANLAVFVPNTIPGEQVSCRVTEVKKTFARASLLEIIRRAPARMDPHCNAFSLCGGCHLQHIDYSQQLQFKADQVDQALRRLGKLEGYHLRPVIGMDYPWHYRNKAFFHVASDQSNIQLGFFQEASHALGGNVECALLPKDMVSLARDLEQLLNCKEIREGLFHDGKCQLIGVVIRQGLATGEVMLVLVTTSASLSLQGIAATLMEDRTELVSVMQNIKDPDSGLPVGENNLLLGGRDHIMELVGEFQFMISPGSFFQVNSIMAENLFNLVAETAALSPKDSAVDLYCGTGAISLFLAKSAGLVYGVETFEKAVEDAEKNAWLNGIENVRFLPGEAEAVLPDLYSNGFRPEVVVLDPPRQGCSSRVLETVINMEPQRIVYVSCNPATLARDLSYLAAHNYSIGVVQPVDMFPHTYHVECIVQIKRVETRGLSRGRGY
ncbi:MAG: 23S rRNA (uracil(1939)-C(5))-methyltransferase RlmD [Bacillota bacterium]